MAEVGYSLRRFIVSLLCDGVLFQPRHPPAHTMSDTEIITPSIPEQAAADPVAAAPAQVRFADFALSPDILRALDDQGYVPPTPIQAQAIPVLLKGRDVMGA